MKIRNLEYTQALALLNDGSAIRIYKNVRGTYDIVPHYQQGDYISFGGLLYFGKEDEDDNVTFHAVKGKTDCIMDAVITRPDLHIRNGTVVEPTGPHKWHRYINKHMNGESFMIKIGDKWLDSVALRDEKITFDDGIECKDNDKDIKIGDVVVHREYVYIVTNAKTLMQQYGLGRGVPPDKLVLYRTDPLNTSYGISWTTNLSGISEIKRKNEHPRHRSTSYVFDELNTAINKWFKPKINVGDIVCVLAHPSGDNYEYNNTDGFNNVWVVSSMNAYVGKTCKITDITAGGVAIDCSDYRFPPDALEVING